MATTTRYPIRIPLRLPRPIEPTESPASKPNRPQTPNLPPTLHTSAPCFRSKQRQPTRSNLHSLNSWPAVQCNEGFCNAPQKSVLYPDHDHGVAETSPFREIAGVRARDEAFAAVHEFAPQRAGHGPAESPHSEGTARHPAVCSKRAIVLSNVGRANRKPRCGRN